MRTKLTLLTICLLLLTTLTFANKNNEPPKKIKILSQSGTKYTLFVTVIDLENNEIVILEYNTNQPMTPKGGSLLNVIRTGMYVDPNKQSKYLGTDAPFESEKKSS